MAHQAQDAGVVDFYVFHHYREFLPPPADHVRAMMAAPAAPRVMMGRIA